MAENENILQRLGNLFQSNIIIRKNDSGGVVVKDVKEKEIVGGVPAKHIRFNDSLIDIY